MPARRLPRKQQPQNLKVVSKAPVKSSSNDATTPTAKSSSNDETTRKCNPSEDQKLQKEINWCIDQFRLGLMTQKSTQKQTEFTIKLIQTLSSPSAPLVKKRQIMRQAFGDYRKKIADEEAKWLKDAQRLQKVSSIQDSSYPNKSIFIRNSHDTGTASLSKMLAACSVKNASSEEISAEDPEEFRFDFTIAE